MSKKAWIIFIAISLIFGFMMFNLSKQNKIDFEKIDISKPIAASEQTGEIADHIYHKNEGKAVLVEYADYQCPACASASKRIKAIADDYKDKLTVVFRNFPLQMHPNALSAAAAAESAGLQGKYWQMQEILFDNQTEWGYASAQERGDFYNEYAKRLGLDQNKFIEDMKSPKVLAKINFDKKVAAQAKIDATPSFVLNGKKIDSNTASDDAKLRALIDEAIK